MITLIYYSTAINMFSIEDFILLQKQCVEGNIPLGITGILLYNKGSIMQILEGEATAVESLFEKIKIDKRHEDVYRLNSYAISQRSYKDWSMQFKVISDQNWSKLENVIKVDNVEGGIHPIRTSLNIRLVMLIDTFINIGLDIQKYHQFIF